MGLSFRPVPTAVRLDIIAALLVSMPPREHSTDSGGTDFGVILPWPQRLVAGTVSTTVSLYRTSAAPVILLSRAEGLLQKAEVGLIHVGVPVKVRIQTLRTGLGDSGPEGTHPQMPEIHQVNIAVVVKISW